MTFVLAVLTWGILTWFCNCVIACQTHSIPLPSHAKSKPVQKPEDYIQSFCFDQKNLKNLRESL